MSLTLAPQQWPREKSISAKTTYRRKTFQRNKKSTFWHFFVRDIYLTQSKESCQARLKTRHIEPNSGHVRLPPSTRLNPLYKAQYTSFLQEKRPRISGAVFSVSRKNYGAGSVSGEAFGPAGTGAVGCGATGVTGAETAGAGALRFPTPLLTLSISVCT
jgi:hypothetical protein